MTRLELALLGPYQVTLGGQPVTGFASDKTRALLVYLAVETHHPHARQALIELLWPDSPARTAQENLEQALSNLCHTIGDRQAWPFVLFSQETVQFNPASDHWLDVRAFNDLIRTWHTDRLHLRKADESALKRLQRAVELYRGAFLEDFSVGESVPFEEWALFTREKLHHRALEALHRLAETHEARGEYEQACVYARRQIELEPWREAAHRQLMRALALDGQQSAALAQYEACRRVLVEELGAEPAEETTALEQQIRAGELSAPHSASGASAFSISTLQTPPCPYRGLFAFCEKDAPFFFGREAFTERLLETVRQQTLVAVIGASGSGKSSIAFAGLLPHLRQEGTWAISASRPGGRPFHALSSGLSALLAPRTEQMDASAKTGRWAEALSQGALPLSDMTSQILDQQRSQGIGRLLFVLDQFEELYTLCPEPEMRRRFLDQLLLAIQEKNKTNSLHLVLTLRADFMGQALAHRPFADALQDAALMLGPMSRQELSWAIENPAKRQGVAFEAGLAARILDDVGDEPGNLPLLQFALTALWERQAGGLLTHAAYEAVGRVQGALAHHADQVYAELRPSEQQSMRRVLVQMVRPGEGTEDTRRLAVRTELGERAWSLVQRLADARLVVTDRDPTGCETVEVVHEALIRGWRRLQAWMNEDRAFRTWQERLRVALRQWETSGQDEGALLRGALLAEAEEWATARGDDLSPPEREFLEASVRLRDQRRSAEEARRQRELAQTRALAEAERRRAEEQTRSSQRLRALVGGLAAMFLVAVVAAFLAVGQRREAEQHAATAKARREIAEAAQAKASAAQAIAESRRQEAEAARKKAEAAEQAAETERDRAEANARVALSRQLAAQALIHMDKQLDRALLLALQANRIASTVEARNSLLSTVEHNPALSLFMSGHTAGIYDVVFGPEGAFVASGGLDNTIIVWNTTTGQPVTTLKGHTAPINDLDLSPDGTYLASASDDHTVVVWEVTSGRSVVTLKGHTDRVMGVAFGPDGTYLASASWDSTVGIWDVSTLRHAKPVSEQPVFTLRGHSGTVWGVAFSPDGTRLASSGQVDHSVIIWDVASGQRLDTFEGHTNSVNGIVFSPDGTLLASTSDDQSVIIWEVASGEPVATLEDHTDTPVDVSFSPDGAYLASGGWDNTLILWDVASKQPVKTLKGHTAAIYGVDFSPDGAHLVSGSLDTTVIVWEVSSILDMVVPGGELVTVLEKHTDQVFSLAFSPDGAYLASGAKDTNIVLWNMANRRPVATLVGHTDRVISVAFSPDGAYLASGSRDQVINLWDVASMLEAGATSGEPIATLKGHTDWVTSVAFSPDGALLAAGSQDTHITVWEVSALLAAGAGGEQPLVTLDAHTAPVNSVAFGPDGAYLASGSGDQTAIIWQVSSREPIFTLDGHTAAVASVTFSPNGAYLASGAWDSLVILWEVTSGQAVTTFEGHTDPVLTTTFGPDGTYLASGSRDKTVIVWNLAPLDPETTGEPKYVQVTDHVGRVNSTAFHPDGRLLASADGSSTIRLWDLSFDSWKTRACRRANRNLTQAEWEKFIGPDTLYQQTCPDLS